jgi:hypothetical protein
MKIIRTFESFDEHKRYEFDDLSQEAQQTAIENERNSMDEAMGEWWYEPIIEGETEKLKSEGFDDIDIQFSGFHSQGDGASFTGEIPDRETFVKETLGMEMPDEVLENMHMVVIRTDTRHLHENTVRFDCEVDGEDEIQLLKLGADVDIKLDVQEYCDKIEKVASVWVKSRCQEIYSKLNKEYDSYFEEDHIIADIKANELKFDEDGNIA